MLAFGADSMRWSATDDELKELTYTLLGTGRLNARTHPVWHGNGKQRDLAPRVWPVTARHDWLRPLRLVSWQPLRTPTLGGMCVPPEMVATSAATAALRAHASRATPVPDGVVPAELLSVLTTIGVPAGSATKAAAMIVVAQCEGAHLAQLTSCRRNAAHLRAIGVPIPRTDGTPSLTHPCARCNTHCTVLFLVRRDIGVRAAAMVDSASRQRIRELMSDGRVSASHPTRVALCNIYKDQGIHTCFTCASGAMAESFARQQTPCITSPSTSRVCCRAFLLELVAGVFVPSLSS